MKSYEYRLIVHLEDESDEARSRYCKMLLDLTDAERVRVYPIPEDYPNDGVVMNLPALSPKSSENVLVTNKQQKPNT